MSIANGEFNFDREIGEANGFVDPKKIMPSEAESLLPKNESEASPADANSYKAKIALERLEPLGVKDQYLGIETPEEIREQQRKALEVLKRKWAEAEKNNHGNIDERDKT